MLTLLIIAIVAAIRGQKKKPAIYVDPVEYGNWLKLNVAKII